MYIQNKDRYSLIEAYNTVRECECQHAINTATLNNNSNERIDMILNNLVNLNNKAAELVKTMQTAVDSGEEIDEWVSEKIAIASSMIGGVNDYYAKFKSSNSNLSTTMTLGSIVGDAGGTIRIPANNLASISI